LHSVQDEKTGKITHLSVACQHLDIRACRCLIYEDRLKIESECERLSLDKIRRTKKLPRACAYRCLVEGRELEWWHPLVSGDPNTVHEAGVSVRGKAVKVGHVNLDDFKYLTVGK
jgi:uncharacterized cysteine cluster protein YcgN (CxxCxxCC family)